MTEPESAICMTCHGAGEIPTDLGPEVCPDCQGDHRSPGRRQLLEWRLRDIERVHVAVARHLEQRPDGLPEPDAGNGHLGRPGTLWADISRRKELGPTMRADFPDEAQPLFAGAPV